jgi:hypothetical protein
MISSRGVVQTLAFSSSPPPPPFSFPSPPLPPLCNLCARLGHIRGRCRNTAEHLPHIANADARAASRLRTRTRMRMQTN